MQKQILFSHEGFKNKLGRPLPTLQVCAEENHPQIHTLPLKNMDFWKNLFRERLDLIKNYPLVWHLTVRSELAGEQPAIYL